MERAFSEWFGGPVALAGRKLPAKPKSPELRREQHEAGLECARELEERLGGQILTSVSHSGSATGSQVVAVGIPAGPPRKIHGIGIDLERADRAISREAYMRISTPGERTMPIRPIDLWTIKEACFKSNPRNSGIAIPRHQVTAFFPASAAGHLAEGFAKMEVPGRASSFGFALTHQDGWVLTIAQSKVF